MYKLTAIYVWATEEDVVGVLAIERAEFDRISYFGLKPKVDVCLFISFFFSSAVCWLFKPDAVWMETKKYVESVRESENVKIIQFRFGIRTSILYRVLVFEIFQNSG